jgi:heat shock protein HspQ
MVNAVAKYRIGTQVKHRVYGFRGIVFDVDPTFGNTEEWYQSIPEDVRPKKDQPFYHLLAETPEKTPYIAYVSEQNLVPDSNPDPIHHPGTDLHFQGMKDGHFVPKAKMN